jgi:ABC-type glutathione transport system ATPase component
MKVYALVGKSGTGKSYQAQNLCRELKIKGIIDDGLFIYENKVISGISAKRQDFDSLTDTDKVERGEFYNVGRE